MELENIILSKVSQAQKAKNLMFSLICRLLPKKIAVILLDLGHTLRGDHAWEGKGKGVNQNLECG
jgi:hypothetical protein